MSDENISKYINDLKEHLSKKKVVSRPLSDLANFPLAKGQALYVLDYKKKSITFQNGIKELLGYPANEFTFDLVLTFFHPNDKDILDRLIKATLTFATENDVSQDLGYYVTYRIRCKDGSYMKVLRQSNIFDKDENGRIISNSAILTDIGFMDSSEKVQWRFDAPGLDQKKFREYIIKEYTGFFSERELEVLSLLKDGLKSTAIAEKLAISKHTVDGHRRKMLQKSNSKNTIDLINFGKNNGLL